MANHPNRSKRAGESEGLIDEEAMSIAAQTFANNFDGGQYDPLDPPAPDPLRRAIMAYMRFRR